MSKRRVVTVALTLVVLAFGGFVAYRYLASGPAGRPDAIGIQVKQNIRAVYQIETADKKGEVSAGLHYLKKLVDTYDDLGIEESQRHLHGVFHDGAGHFLLEDDAFAGEGEGPAENPNEALVQELLDRGVHLELCGQTMAAQGWSEGDLLDGVDVVVGAYPRVIDLQLSGYAYVRF